MFDTKERENEKTETAEMYSFRTVAGCRMADHKRDEDIREKLAMTCT
jgi:hypothetical protein